ncbi:MAG: PEP-CTERM sorting domain-containing protein [Anaerohalosphaeraceae bacterium]|nr:PEP-CTERM sorting domain-containing protein [Anaerohalosphaeraceae bacterium]
MKRFFFLSLFLLLMCSVSIGVPITYNKTPNPDQTQDWLPEWTHELGIGFPDIQLIEATWEYTSLVACQPGYEGGQNILITMTNLTGIAWKNVTYVADPETTITNDDRELVNGEEAFLIDYIGVNQPLVFESLIVDTIFQPGETWQFIIQEYNNTLGLSPAAFLSWDSINNLGLVGGQSGGDYVSSGSIIVIPEPVTIVLLGIGGLFLRRSKH